MKERKVDLIFCSAALILLLMANGLWGQTAIEKKEYLPIIQVIPERFDFGRVPPMKTSRLFLVKNIGNAVLEIYHISTSCGCTTASVDKKMIEPGKSATMVVSFDPTYSHSHSSEKRGTVLLKRSIYIRSSDPRTPEKTVYITALVRRGG